MATHLRFLAPWVFATTACVSSGKYDAALADSARLSKENENLQTQLGQQRAAAGQELAASRAAVEACERQLDDHTAIIAELRGELERMGKDADALLSTRGALAASLEQAKSRLEELRKAKAAADARAALYRELAMKLKRMVDAGELEIVLRRGRMVLVLPNDVLFDSGKADVKPRGKDTLMPLAVALATFPDRTFQVAGHTDNEPIRLSGFASNWQLSTERALAVSAVLVSGGMKPESLSVAGYGEFDPVAVNSSPQGKAKNRRIEITVQPNIDEIVAVPPTQ
jgi:chemotaxis protein MotB